MSQNFAAFEPYAEVEQLLYWLKWRYGFEPSVFAGHRFWQRPGSPAIWIAAEQCTPCANLRLESIGITVLRDPPPRGMLCNVFALRFGDAASKHVVTLTNEQAELYLARESVQLEQDTTELQGFVIVRRADRVLGCGKVVDHLLESHLPRAWLQGV